MLHHSVRHKAIDEAALIAGRGCRLARENQRSNEQGLGLIVHAKGTRCKTASIHAQGGSASAWGDRRKTAGLLPPQCDGR